MRRGGHSFNKMVKLSKISIFGYFSGGHIVVVVVVVLKKFPEEGGILYPKFLNSIALGINEI